MTADPTFQNYEVRRSCRRATLAEKRSRLVRTHLRAEVKKGRSFFKASQLAEAVGLNSHQVGAQLAALAKDPDADLEASIYSHNSTGHTWRIVPRSQGGSA